MLLRAQDVSATANFKVSHSNLKAAAKLCKLTYRL